MNTKLSLVYLLSHNKSLEKKCTSFLDSCPQAFFQQTLEWRSVIESMKTDQSIYVIAQKGTKIVGLLPLYIFESTYGNIINSISYPGPLGGIVIKNNHRHKDTIFKLLIHGLDNIAKEKKCVLATLISSPFNKDASLYRKYFQPDWELENYTLYIDLTKPRQTNSHFRNNLQRMLKRANTLGYKILSTTDIKKINIWHSVHQKRHQEIDLEPIPKNIITGTLKYLTPKNKATFFLTEANKKIHAGCLVCYHKKIIDTYMYSGEKEAYKNGAIYLLIDHILNWATEKGFHIFNWQSSKPKGGGPYNFKMQWGSKESPYFFFTKQYGSINKIVKLGVDGVKKNYKWHFVLPYSLLENS